MQISSLPDWAVLAGVAVLGCLGAGLWLMSGLQRPPHAGGQKTQPAAIADMVFLFDGADLIDSSTTAWHFLGRPEGGFSWAQFQDLAGARYPGLPDNPDDWRDRGQVVLRAADSGRHGELLFEWIDGIARVQLLQPGRNLAAATGSQELSMLRDLVGKAPFPVWRIDGGGRPTWSNAAYQALRKTAEEAGADPEQVLFAHPPTHKDNHKARVGVSTSADGPKLWYDVTWIAEPDGWLCYAGDVNAVVEAEAAQRNFVQTLAKTFAQLSTGLAIFDRNRQLALFNPSLIDLTALPADFLSRRPSILGFFDRLRDQRMMPEPKNYGSWRQQMNDLVVAAADGRYQETWSLPSGSVYSVSGRPHPDGAVAFLFEDITAEITLTRRFRSELELGQSILDHLEDAIVVFAPDGTQSYSNAAYNRMWGVDPENAFADVAVTDATRLWQDNCLATPLWGEIRDFVALRENRAEWWGRVSRKSGDGLLCSITPIQRGATLVRFSELEGTGGRNRTRRSKDLIGT